MGGEALVLGVLAVIAGVLLVTGLIQAFQTPVRRRVRQGRFRPRTRVPARRGEAASEPGGLQSPHRDLLESAPHATGGSGAEVLPVLPAPAPASAPGEEARAPQGEIEPAGAPTTLEPERWPLEECFTLYQAGQYQELLSVAEPSLRRARNTVGGAERASELSALWSLVGLSKQALNDEQRGRAAFQEAVHAAPETDRATYLRYLAALGEAAEEKLINPLRRDVLWIAYGHVANILVQRQEFLRARRLSWEALGDEELPAHRREAFREILSTAYAREIEQLTADAIGTLQDEGEALLSLQRAEGLLSSIPDDALTPERYEEVHRRLWEGYTKLGIHRMEAGEFENALEPLYHALLEIIAVDSERQQETRQALIRALEAAVEIRSEYISQLLKDGKRAAAFAESERVLALIRQGLEAGLSDDEVTVPLAKARQVIGQVSRG